MMMTLHMHRVCLQLLTLDPTLCKCTLDNAYDIAYAQSVLTIVNISYIVSKCTMGYADDTAYA